MIFNLMSGGSSAEGNLEDCYAVLSVDYPIGWIVSILDNTTLEPMYFSTEDEQAVGKSLFGLPDGRTIKFGAVLTDEDRMTNVVVLTPERGMVYHYALQETGPTPTPTTGTVYLFGFNGIYGLDDGTGRDPIGTAVTPVTSATFLNVAPGGPYIAACVPADLSGARYYQVSVTAGETVSIDMRNGSQHQEGSSSDEYGAVYLRTNPPMTGYFGIDDGTYRDPVYGTSAKIENILPGTYTASFLGETGVIYTKQVTVTAGMTIGYILP